MKKITLFIAFLAISIGSVWGQIDNEKYSVSPTSDTKVPFNWGVSSEQTCTLTYSASSFAQVLQGTSSDPQSPQFPGDYEYFKSMGFVASDVRNCPTACNVRITSTKGTNTFNCTVSFANGVLTIVFDNQFQYSKNDGNLTVEVTCTLPTDASGIWNTANTNTTFSGSRKFEVTNNNCTYTVHTGTYKASLKSVDSGFQSDGEYYISSATKSDPSAAEVTGEKYSLYTFKEFFVDVVNDVPHQIQLDAIENTAFKNFQIDKNSAFEFSGISSIGNDISKNECFAFTVSSGNKVILIFNGNNISSGIFHSENNDFSGLTNQAVHFMVGPSAQSIPNLSGYGFSSVGKSWHPFRLKVKNMHKFQLQYTGYDNYIKVSQYPFAGIDLMVTLDDQYKEPAHDGTFCQYFEMKNVLDGESNTIELTNKKEFSFTLTQNQEISILLNYRNYLLYGKGNPYFDYSEAASVVNVNSQPVLCYGSNGVTFKYSESSDNNECVPYWRYNNKNDVTDAPQFLSIDCPVYVEKEITSAHYRYFSLPFDCPIDAIDVRLLDGQGNPTGDALPLFKWDFDEYGNITGGSTSSGDPYSNQNDYYIINEYKGQQSGNGGLPEYDIVKSGNLSANKGYAFAIVESEANHNSNTEVKALITFKSQGKPTMPLSTCSLSIQNMSTNTNTSVTEDRNKGWYMIGSPYYHYIKANSFYGVSNHSAFSSQVKYVTTINDDYNETVTHRWVNSTSTWEDIKNSDDAQSYTIKPFEAFFVQLPENTSLTAYPFDAGFSYQPSTSTEQENQAVSRIPAEEEEIQEHLSVKVSGQDGSFDRTTVINDESRDEHFKMMDDLAKIMNPGVQIYTWYDSVPCAFKELPMRADSTMAIPLGVRVTEAGNYTFALDTNLTFFYGAAMLHDKQMNQYYPLNENGVQISLSVVGEVNDRFEVVIIPSEIPADVENIETSESLDAYVHDGRLVVENIEDGSTLSIFDVSGKMLYTAPAAGDFNYQFSAHGVYMVVLQGNTTGSIKVVY